MLLSREALTGTCDPGGNKWPPTFRKSSEMSCGDMACWVGLSETAVATRQCEIVLNHDAIMHRRVAG